MMPRTASGNRALRVNVPGDVAVQLENYPALVQSFIVTNAVRAYMASLDTGTMAMLSQMADTFGNSSDASGDHHVKPAKGAKSEVTA